MIQIDKNSKLFWALFTVMVLVQIAVPAYMAYSSEETRAEGRIYKFELGAIDPYDPFRGKFIILNPRENFLSGYHASCIDCPLYASFTENERGFAELTALSDYSPASSEYIQVTSRSNNTMRGQERGTLITYPFSKYFMNEHKAKPAEDLIRAARRDTTRSTYAEVSVLNGKAQVLNIMIDDDNLLDLLDKENK